MSMLFCKYFELSINEMEKTPIGINIENTVYITQKDAWCIKIK
jgi:hypothetical protein